MCHQLLELARFSQTTIILGLYAVVGLPFIIAGGAGGFLLYVLYRSFFLPALLAGYLLEKPPKAWVLVVSAPALLFCAFVSSGLMLSSYFPTSRGGPACPELAWLYASPFLAPLALWAGSRLRARLPASGLWNEVVVSGRVRWGAAALCAALTVPIFFACLVFMTMGLLDLEVDLARQLGYPHLTAAPGFIRNLHVLIPQALSVALPTALSLYFGRLEACVTLVLSLVLAAPAVLMM